MTRHKPKVVLAIVLALATFTASACSLLGGDDATPDSTTPGSGSTEGSGAAGASSDGFQVIGKDIIDPEGNIFVPSGANAGVPFFDEAGERVKVLAVDGYDITSDEAVAGVEAWGWNVLRANAFCKQFEPDPGQSPWGNKEMFEALDKMVETYTKKKIVVMIECHDLTGKNIALDDPDYQQITAFWETAIEKYGDNPYVWFNHLNEFHATGDDGTTPEEIAYWSSVVQNGYDLFASKGAKNLLVFDLPNFGQRLKTTLTPEFETLSSGMCNVVWDWHSYGGIRPTEDWDFANPDPAAFEAEVSSLLDQTSAAGIPLVVGEVGYDWDSERKKTNFQYPSERLGALTAVKLAPNYGLGVLAWTATGDSGDGVWYNLKKGDKLTFAQPTPESELSEFGEQFWELSQTRKNAEAQAAPAGEGCQR